MNNTCDWITSVSAVICTISPGESLPVSIGIDRSKFVTSNNGSNMLEIKATGI